MKKAQQSLFSRRIVGATRHSILGLRSAWRSEEAFRLEIVFASALVVLAFFVGRSPVEVTVLILSVLQVLITELLNTGIEKAIDRVGYESHPLSGMAKDVGSAAVFISLGGAVFAWVFIGLQ